MITETDLTAADKTKALHRISAESLLKNIKLSYVPVLVLQELVKCGAQDNDFALTALERRDVVVFNKLAHGIGAHLKHIFQLVQRVCNRLRFRHIVGWLTLFLVILCCWCNSGHTGAFSSKVHFIAS